MINDYEYIINNNFLLLEVSEYAPPILKNIEKIFDKYKSNTNELRKKILPHIKKFTNIDNIIIEFDDQYNAGIIPVYKPLEKNKFKEIFTAAIGGKNNFKTINPDELKKLKMVSEPSESIDTIYLILGKPLIKKISGGEFVALLLHELGHVYSTSTNTPYQFLVWLKKLLNLGIGINTLLHSLANLVSLFNVYTVFAFISIHGISFFNRRSEYIADQYVIKYGYGDELITLLNKFNKSFNFTSKQSFGDKVKNLFMFLDSFIQNIMLPSDHPSNEQRISKIENAIFKKYKSIYPNYSDVLNKVQDNINKKRKMEVKTL